MKKKLIIISSAIIFAMILVTNIHLSTNNYRISLFLPDLTVMAKADSEGGGNQATCYSTYQEPGFLQKGTMIWVCGSCVQVEAKVFSDAGICNF